MRAENSERIVAENTAFFYYHRKRAWVSVHSL